MNGHGAIIEMFGGCHHAEGKVGIAIIVFTTWGWRWVRPLEISTHSSVGFIFEDGYQEIWEAREGQSWQGPIDVEKVKAWEGRNPKKRRFTIYPIPMDLISQESMERKKEFSMLITGGFLIFRSPKLVFKLL